MIDPRAYPSGVVGDVVDAIRNRSPEFGNDEVVHANRFGRTFRPPFAPGVLDVADEFFLLRVDGYRRVVRSERFLHPIVDGVELRITIDMARSLARLPIGLQAVIELVQELPHQPRPILWPMPRRPSASLRRLLHVQSSGDCRSPRVAGSTREADHRAGSHPSRPTAQVHRPACARVRHPAVPQPATRPAHARSCYAPSP